MAVLALQQMEEGGRANYCFVCLVLSLKLSREGKNPCRHQETHVGDSNDISRETRKVPDISRNQQPKCLEDSWGKAPWEGAPDILL